MPTIFTKDTLRASVEASTGGKVTVLYDDKGFPSYMNIIPKFKVEDIDASLGTGVHPAFIVGGVEKSEIFIGQHLANVRDDRAVSLPGVDPKTGVTYDQAKAYCKNKGGGWHLMTNWEWAALSLWSLKNGFQPRGNTNYGRSHEATYETGVRMDGGVPGENTGTPRTLSGSGPASWRHDNTPSGVADLVGNVREWQDGLKIVDGKIFMPADNNYSLPEANWNDTGVYFDATIAGGGIDGTYGDVGDPVLSDSITNYSGPVGDVGSYDYASIAEWKALTSKAGWTVPVSMKQALIYPYDSTAAKGNLYVRNYGERMPIRGGSWNYGASAGLGSLHLSDARSSSGSTIGFRPAFIM
ncbi:MAG: SUMF1/EgtB/PvdO family nonheme iron enzyme [Sulfuricurvum sp.]|nr:SUMF1/EgtB/PvdO family nonheme iron enzyme [Sulfuricurvum sp.]